jgi:hypothetical protein
LECPNLLHWPQITSILLPSLPFICLVGGSSNFRYSLAYSYFLYKWLQLPCVRTMCPSSSPLRLSGDMVVNLFKRKWLANYRLFDVKGILLISIYVHNTSTFSFPLGFITHNAMYTCSSIFTFQ